MCRELLMLWCSTTLAPIRIKVYAYYNSTKMAETEGFEPSDPISGVFRLAGEPFRPLRHVSYKMAEGEGFEPIGPLRSHVFKTCAINQTLPTFHKCVFRRFRSGTQLNGLCDVSMCQIHYTFAYLLLSRFMW